MIYYSNRKYLHNDISPRNFNLLGIVNAERVSYNYAKEIAHRAKTETELHAIFRMAYGDNWYLQPYSKLYRLANACPKVKTVRSDYKDEFKRIPMEVVLTNDVLERKKEAFYDNYLCRYARKQFGAKTVDNFINKINPQSMNHVIGQLKNISLLAFYMNGQDKDILKQVKDMFFGDDSTYQYTAHYTVRTLNALYRNQELAGIIGQESVSAIARTYVEGEMCKGQSPYLPAYKMLEPSIDNIEHALKSLSTNIKNECNWSQWEQMYAKTIARESKKLLKVVSFINDMKKLEQQGIRIWKSNGVYLRGPSRGDINGRLYKIVHKMAQQDSIDEADMQMLHQLSQVIYSDDESKNKFVAVLCYKLS